MSPHDPSVADPISPEALDRFLAGECARDERARVERYLVDHPDAQARLAFVRTTLAFGPALDSARPLAQLDALKRMVQPAGRSVLGAASTPATASRRSISASAPRSARWLRLSAIGVGAAAAVAAIIMVGARTRGAETVLERTYATAREQRATITLPDGSLVVLAPETRLLYRANRRGARQVELAGQAYFTVIHDPAREFAVHAGPVQLRVLGTAFDVRHYVADGGSARVSMVDGKVSVGDGRVLAAGDIGEFTDSTATVTTAGDVTMATEWTRGRLVFKEAPVRDVLASVGHWYGYNFELADSAIARQHVTTTLVIGKPRETLRAIEEVLDVTMTYRGNVIVLRAKRDGNTHDSRRAPAARHDISTLREVGK